MNQRSVMCVLLSMALCTAGCGVVVRSAVEGFNAFRNSELFHQGRHGSLTDEEKNWAKLAWSYFKNNTEPNTGTVNAVEGYPSTTVWHIADYLAALVSAHELELIGRDEFDQRLSQLLHFLNTMQLFQERLPNKAYNTRTGAMVNYENQPGEIGWSCLDIGRLLTWLAITKCRYPTYREYIDKVVVRWVFCDVISVSGNIQSGIKAGDKIQLFREDRLGYEEYAAKGFQLWGFDTIKVARPGLYDNTYSLYGIEIPYDIRNPKESGTYSPVLSMGFLLDGMEFNWDRVDDLSNSDRHHSDQWMAKVAEDIYRVQEARYQNEHILTARTDHQLPEPPYFVYDSILAGGYPWNVISDSGQYLKDSASVATKAAFGMWALWKTPYTSELIQAVSSVYNPERGWYEGRLEKTGGYLYVLTGATNSAVLEALLYRVKGRLLKCTEKPGFYSLIAQDPFKGQGHCFPQERTTR